MWSQWNLWHVVSDPRGYFFWLVVVSLAVAALERLFPWRREQSPARRGIVQDLFFLIFNGHYAGMMLAMAAGWLTMWLERTLNLPLVSGPRSWNLLADTPLWVQFVVFFLLKDLLEYSIHNLLHRVPWLWQFHKLHHSIVEMDWIGNFRFHWMEIVVYRSLSYFPLVVLGVDGGVILTIAVIATLIGHLNHANLNWTYGPLGYIFNSPRFHIWHHDVIPHGGHGKNFAIVFSIWDWLFGTAYRPAAEQPDELGFDDLDRFPESLPRRLLYPWVR
ncbi:Sterol desaturase family protein [Sulfidibacter corallicola]|uniref:Sterol desaturase family protein n=1 Tax=Sulfidibacter corallicola TaxID=2818388 RepID=A0A8A4TKJ3_SULCO|nr:sterol desaturase family protein [Sulfidibacter corallicola]QTD50529.1 sterol desaturase family protein [Sulfidibacter corallicola]